jgi:PAS domain S-box-containing protein
MTNSEASPGSDPAGRPNPDIADGERAEEMVRKERDFSAAVLDTAGALIVVLDKEGRITRFNRACELITGYPAAEVLGRVLWEFLIPPEELPGVHQTWEALQAGDFPNQHENHWLARDGSRRLIAWSNTAIVTPAGEIDSIIGIGLDITRHKLAEAALERSERLYRAIGESIDYGVWVCEPDGRNIYASPSFLKLVGLTQEQCSNFGWGDVLHPDDAARTIAAWKECVRTGGTWDIEHRFRGVDGQWHPILARGMPVRDEQGKVMCWAGINLDISRLKQAERELFDANQRLQALMRAVPVGVSFSDDPTCRRITGNPAVLAQFEVGAADNLSASAPEPVAPGRQLRFFREGRPVEDSELPLQRAVAENSVIPPMELEVHLPSGRRWFAEASGAPVLGPHGEVVGGLAVTVDITARKQAEDELRRRAEQLGASLEELTRFNEAMVGRELRMVELKQEINALCAQLGQPPRYARQPETEPPKIPDSP